MWFLAARSHVRELGCAGLRPESSDVRGCCRRELHRRELASEPGMPLVSSHSVLG